MGLVVWVGQITSSKGLDLKFIIVVITNVRMIAWGGGGGHDTGQGRTLGIQAMK